MMSELENSRRTTLQTEKVTAWQEIAQRLAHEIRNPLTPIKLSAQRILRRYEKDPDSIGEILEGSVSSIIREVENLDLLLQEFRDFARLPRPSRYPINLAGLLDEIRSQYRSGYPDVSFDFSTVNREIELPLDREQISRVFTNLFKNALESMDNKGTILVRTDLVRKGNTRYCRVQVEDSPVAALHQRTREKFLIPTLPQNPTAPVSDSPLLNVSYLTTMVRSGLNLPTESVRPFLSIYPWSFKHEFGIGYRRRTRHSQRSARYSHR